MEPECRQTGGPLNIRMDHKHLGPSITFRTINTFVGFVWDLICAKTRMRPIGDSKLVVGVNVSVDVCFYVALR